MNRTTYKTLSSELRKSLFQGQFHKAGAVMIIRHQSGLEAITLDRLIVSSSMPVDRSWMSKASRRSLLSNNSPRIPLPL